MSRVTQVILSAICLVAVVECLPFQPVKQAAGAVDSILDGFLGKDHGKRDSPITASPIKRPNGDIGFDMSGSAVRPPPQAIHTGKPRPTVNDVINALQNLTTKTQKDTENKPPVSIVTVSPPAVISPYPTPSLPPTHDASAHDTDYPDYPPVDDQTYPPTEPPVYPTNNPALVVDTERPDQGSDNKANQSIIILNLNDLQGVQYDGSSLMQLFSILNGKPGFVYVMIGGQGKFIPLNQLHLLPQNGVPSYVVLLTPGRPNAVPGLQLINGLYPNGNLGNLGFQIPNLGSFSSLPIYVVQGYYPIWSILMNLGIYQPGVNPIYYPHPDPTPYPNIVNIRTTPAPTLPPYTIPTNPPVVVTTASPQLNNIDLDALLGLLGHQGNGNNVNIDSSRDDVDVPDSELIKILLKVLNEKPGSEAEHVIVQQKRNPMKLLHILIELLGRKTGSEHVIVNTQHENNPSRLLQILIQLLRQKNASSHVVISNNNDNSEVRLIRLLVKLIRQQNQREVVVTNNNDGNRAQLMQILMRLLSNKQQLNNIMVSNQVDDSQSRLLQYLIQLLGSSYPEAGNILISSNNDANSAQKLYNILLQIVGNMPDYGSNIGSVINLNGDDGYSGISADSLMQLVQILLKQRQSQSLIVRDKEPSISSQFISDGGLGGSDSKILTMLLGSGGGRSNKAALWSYLLGDLGCMNHSGRTVLCAK